MKIIGIEAYTVPMFGNRRSLPYGKLRVADDEGKNPRIVDIKDGEAGNQYVTYQRKRYGVINTGSLYSPRFVTM